MTKQEIINEQVQARIARANALIIKKNGVNPNDSRYQKKRDDLRYAWQHNISYRDVAKHKKGKIQPKEVIHPTAAEVEKMLGRQLRNKRPEVKTSTGNAVRDVLTGKRYESLRAAAKAYGVWRITLQNHIETKTMFNKTYFEYA